MKRKRKYYKKCYTPIKISKEAVELLKLSEKEIIKTIEERLKKCEKALILDWCKFYKSLYEE